MRIDVHELPVPVEHAHKIEIESALIDVSPVRVAGITVGWFVGRYTAEINSPATPIALAYLYASFTVSRFYLLV